MWWGRIIGFFLGYLFARWPGAALGVLVGYFFDKGFAQESLIQNLFAGTGKRQKIQDNFFSTTFLIMGCVAKSDGKITQEEIKNIEAVMKRLHVTGERRTQAIHYFQQGKASHFNLDETLNAFKKTCKRHKALFEIFIEIQLQAAYTDGILLDQKKSVLIYVSERLGIDRTLFARLNTMHQAEEKFREYIRQQYQQNFQKMRNTRAIDEAYKILGLQSTASDAEVKKSYRKLMSQHHPDKLIAQGLPEEMIKLTTEKTQEIQNAYDLIMKDRSARCQPL